MSEEIFPIVDDEGEVVGSESREVCHGGSMLLHPVIHVHVFNSRGELYVQQRALNKDIQPGKWDTAVGGHINLGEEVNDAVKRECLEELGLRDVEPVFLYRYQWNSPIETELVHVFTLVYDGTITPNPHELLNGRFWTIDEIRQNCGTGIFTPNFEYDFQLLLDYKVI